jgi:hypothetical protein
MKLRLEKFQATPYYLLNRLILLRFLKRSRQGSNLRPVD